MKKLVLFYSSRSCNLFKVMCPTWHSQSPPKGRERPGPNPAPRRGAHSRLCRLAGFRPRLLRAQPVSADLRPGARAPAAPGPAPPLPVPRCGASPPGARGGGIAAALGPLRAASGPAGAGERGGAAGRGGAAAVSREPSLLLVRPPPGAAMEVYIPSFRYEESDLERGYTVGAGPWVRAAAAESGGCPSGRRRPRAGRGSLLSLPSPGPEEGLRPGAVVKETGTSWQPSGCRRSVPRTSLPRSGSGSQKPGSRVPERCHAPAARPLEPAALRPSATPLLPLPRHSRLRGGWVWASKFCKFPSDGYANF